ncbi:hypothetical protein MJO28_014274 [Puccinia striiformis f. sp. tritici]|uniref:Uncharacterized protein n=1 Tax=Puccinia striiformis f. sp. tritici TaxID=168172 RepID=A0ACC0DTF7_9BASI|nr:hypothetical protein MJO28_014274 [Puccinia striiformis f. sp. tritici]KAI9616478.1 hypothetical protein H4Q26_010873 [Puccinia striiformis f. sp. tritici PST-130]
MNGMKPERSGYNKTAKTTSGISKKEERVREHINKQTIACIEIKYMRRDETIATLALGKKDERFSATIEMRTNET